MAAAGTLFLVPAPLDFGCIEQAPLEQVMPVGTLQVAAGLHVWICENAKTTRAYLKRIHDLYPLTIPVQEQQIVVLPREVHKKGDHGGSFDASGLLAPALEGHDVGLVSEAGMPAIADPGSSVVRAAHDLGIPVVPLVGPVSLVLALAASGMNGQHFAFHGYLPQADPERRQRILGLEAQARRTGETQIFIETPYRNAALLGALLESLDGGTRLAVCAGLTLPGAQCRSAAVASWRQRPAEAPSSPAVFALGR